MLKVLHVPFTFAPDPVGGTEIYVESLSRHLRSHGVESIIAAPSATGVDETYEWTGLRVHRYRYARRSNRMLRELYGEGDPEAARAFAEILDAVEPDVVHLHALSRAVSVLSVKAAKARGIPVLFTYHTPVVSCRRGTLMYHGTHVCDGRLDVQRCTECSLANSGLPKWIAAPLSHMPSSVARALERAELNSGIWTALRMADLVQVSAQCFHDLMREVDVVVALRHWVKALLLRNNVPSSKIVSSPHGLADGGTREQNRISPDTSPLRVAFRGRADRTKGIDTLIKAVIAAREIDVALDLYGVAQSSGDEEYRTKLVDLAGQDSRIRFLPPIPHDRVVPTLGNYHLVAVPSRWMETGPLVVLEAFAAGTPVIGSNLGGIAEWVRNGENGLLVEFDDVAGWSRALKRCARDRALLAALGKGIESPRSMATVAEEMARLYQRHSIMSVDRQSCLQ